MNLEKLYQEMGGDMADAVRRLGSASAVERFLRMFAGDDTFAMLQAAMSAGDVQRAFRAAHTLKGVAQNLGFDRLYTAVFALTEQLRGGKPMQNEQDWLAVQQAQKTVLEGIAQFGQQ